MQVNVLMYNQDDPKKCTAAKLVRFNLAKKITNISRNTLTLNPFADSILLNSDKNKINSSTHHWSHNGSHASYGNSITHTQPLSNDYNIYELIWTNDYIETRLNGKSFHVIDIKSGSVHEPFHNKHFLILNVAVGGNFSGSPNDETVFPQQLMVDYIRVYNL